MIDGPTLVENVARMAARARTAGLELWPHVKTYKSKAIARLQREHGAAGLRSGASPAGGYAITTNLHSRMLVLEGGEISDAWAVDARGWKRTDRHLGGADSRRKQREGFPGAAKR